MTTTNPSSQRLARLSRWIDQHNEQRDAETIAWGRISKIGEEFGEVIAAMIGATGQNPRKGYSHTWTDVEKELLDVAVTALGALTHVRGGSVDALEMFDEHLQAVCSRAGLDETPPPPEPARCPDPDCYADAWEEHTCPAPPF